METPWLRHRSAEGRSEARRAKRLIIAFAFALAFVLASSAQGWK
jgi:hypothetical protein